MVVVVVVIAWSDGVASGDGTPLAQPSPTCHLRDDHKSRQRWPHPPSTPPLGTYIHIHISFVYLVVNSCLVVSLCVYIYIYIYIYICMVVAVMP